MLLDRKAVVVGALLVASALGGTLALGSGCTVLTNDAPPDDAGLFEGGDAQTAACDVCLAAYCAAPEALCLTNSACVGVLVAPDTACSATGDGGAAPERLYHAYTACSDAKLPTCANDCAALNRASSTLPTCSAPDDAGPSDAGSDADADAGEAPDAASADAGETEPDAARPGPDACVTCAAANCSAAVSACASGTECGKFLACSSACKTISCVDDCGSQHATGKVAASELATCTLSNCQKSCEL